MKGFRHSIYWKFFFALLIFISLTASVIGSLFMIYVPQAELNPYIKTGIIQESHKLSARINQSLQNSGAPLGEVIRKIYEEEVANIRVFDDRGNELAFSVIDALKNKREVSSSIIRETLSKGEYFQTIVASPGRQRYYVSSVPLAVAGEPIKILQIYYPLSNDPYILPFEGLEITAIILIAAGLTALLSRFLTRPIRELRKATEKMSQGDFGVRVRVRSRDEIGQLGKTFNEMAKRLSGFQKSRKELLADISHEIRSPLARIQSDAEILIDREIDKEEREEHLKAICEEVKDISKLVEDLFVLSRLEYDQLELEVAPASIQDVLKQELYKFRLQLEKTAITLKQTLPEDMPLVMMDAQRIGQVISNLLTNSIRHTPKGGTVDSGLRKRNSMVEVWVRDTGPGIPKKELPYIFDRFYRVDKSRCRKSGGTDLGLAIAKQFVEAHGGQMYTESEEGKGTCITFTLPIAG